VAHGVLHDDEQIRIDTSRSRNAHACCHHLRSAAVPCSRPHFGQDFLRKLAVDIVAVRKKGEDFYQSLSRETFLPRCSPCWAATAA